MRGRHRASSWCAEALKRAALPPSERHHLLASDPALSVLTAAACRSQDEHHDNPNICRETATSTISNLDLALILPSRNIAAIKSKSAPDPDGSGGLGSDGEHPHGNADEHEPADVGEQRYDIAR